MFSITLDFTFQFDSRMSSFFTFYEIGKVLSEETEVSIITYKFCEEQNENVEIIVDEKCFLRDSQVLLIQRLIVIISNCFR